MIYDRKNFFTRVFTLYLILYHIYIIYSTIIQKNTIQFFIDDNKVSNAYFDRILSNCTGTVCYEFEVKENERKKIDSKIISNRDWSAGNAAVTGTVIIVKTQ